MDFPGWVAPTMGAHDSRRAPTMHTLLRASAVLVTGATLTLAGLGPASADPQQEVVPLVCDDGMTYDVAVAGNGAFTPAHDTASTRMFVPTAFGEFHGVVTDSEGTVLVEFTEPPAMKGRSSKPRATSIECTFTFSGEEVDPEFGLIHFEGTGSVIGFTTPAR